MMTKDQVATSINQAKTDLEQALADLAKLPVFDRGSVHFAAHALKNFLTVIAGTVDLLSDELKEYPDAQVHSWLTGLQHAAHLTMHSVGQLMGASAAASPQLLHEESDLPLLTRRACDFYQRLADRKRIEIAFSSQPDVPPVWTDRVAVAAVLDNLLSNAVKYSPPEKHIFVEVAHEADHVVCSVRDQGPGLSPTDRAQLFRRGVRLSAVPTGGESSTGYGLAVAKALMDKLGGEIWCESELGQGACFSFALPIRP